ncbi:hypothetical protein DIE15_13500 [Burkholderia sp. Bp9031]|uniref:NTF2 fold immunity protein n=1 Tax=Burkholderia sp. Bp9031 TaxID=2184566 RepID=UPI000F5D6AC0|nr:NTF2 fold immunity protein [Burkholderia sp. Bp9031]RQZ16737.1 hypothetical protein DIE15_13500 [Burkholderia sp. Bp9031]
MATEELERARDTLKSFMLEMNRWEDQFFKTKQEALTNNQNVQSVDNEARDKLMEIFDQWTFRDKAYEGRLIDLGCTSPPTYNPDSDVEEHAEMEDGEAVFIIRQAHGLQSQFRFVLKCKNGVWKIKKKELLNFKDKWQRSVL